ncbi:TPA: hypothetical protein ACH3X2_011702 [Trebouxia sp. C0005]
MCLPTSTFLVHFNTYVYCALLLLQLTAEHSQDLMLSTDFGENIQHAWPYGRLVMNYTQCCVAYADRAGMSTYKDSARSRTYTYCNNTIDTEAMISSGDCCEDQQAILVFEPLANELCCTISCF